MLLDKSPKPSTIGAFFGWEDPPYHKKEEIPTQWNYPHLVSRTQANDNLALFVGNSPPTTILISKYLKVHDPNIYQSREVNEKNVVETYKISKIHYQHLWNTLFKQNILNKS